MDPAGVDILAVPMRRRENDAHAETVHDYLISLLSELWQHGEDFSGKRPFGNSGWQYELYVALADAGMVTVKFDSEGYVNSVDTDTADRLIGQAIVSMKGISNNDAG